MIKGKISGFAFKKDDLATILLNKYRELVPPGKYIIDEDSAAGISFAAAEENINNAEVVALKTIINKQVAWRLEEAKIKNEIKGQDEKYVKDYLLSNTSNLEVKVSFWPFWVSRVPRTDKKIQIRLDSAVTVDKIENN